MHRDVLNVSCKQVPEPDLWHCGYREQGSLLQKAGRPHGGLLQLSRGDGRDRGRANDYGSCHPTPCPDRAGVQPVRNPPGRAGDYGSD